MEQITILFFALGSFFGIEDGRIAADRTVITVFPENNEIEIIQEGLFAIIHTENDSKAVLEQWDKILDMNKNRNTKWSQELGVFPVKSFGFKTIENTIRPHFILNYSKEEDLRALGIWYDSESNQFSINNIPQYNIKTESGILTGNYWNFNGDSSFSYTIEPFLEMPEDFQNFKIQLEKLLPENKKE
ncbi:hypothetical protein [Algoriphagus sp. NG3]|uniref:hypothetical protein n=1 Tax=Algoriphagus sp. NG3 TaxID=3097546 RepID=UPI002A833172|nr:hypothetical protein [Algoriphagus sp. NG3]WPR75992.1 hypothetical protein SLW71_01340 [Algoriphagus sp. NG3]